MEDYSSIIKSSLKNVLQTTHVPSGTRVGQRKEGKVRDIYSVDQDQSLLLITTDRLSAFDRILTCIPFKGQVLNQISLWWFKKTSHLLANHILSNPDPNVVLCKKCTVFPVEVVVRGYITGNTETAMWTHYARGERNYCGHSLPEGLTKNQKLDSPLITPTTKEEKHDELISAEEIVKKGLMTEKEWNIVSQKALALFKYGQEVALQHGLILVDTKYEFGKLAPADTEGDEGTIVVVDEIHTPDSSRYWIASSYPDRFANGQNPENIDKDIVRNWYRDHCDPYKDEKLPDAPEELIVTLSQRYIELYERITGEKFQFPDTQEAPHDRLIRNFIREGLVDQGK